MWHGATVRSSIARGRIRAIHFAPGDRLVRVRDCAGKRHSRRKHDRPSDQRSSLPGGARGEPSGRADPAARSPREGGADCGRLPAYALSTTSSRACSRSRNRRSAVANNDVERIIWEGSDYGGTANCFKQYVLYSGEARETEDGLAAAFEAADYIVEGEYHTGAQEQLYIEPNGVIAECEKDAQGNVVSVCVQGSMQCPYYLVHALTLIFELAGRKVQSDSDGDRRGVWRQGRFSVCDRIPCGVAGNEVWPSGEDDLRSR